jgi:thioredoxin reductase (NADPH)
MITVDGLRGIRIFAPLSDAALRYVAGAVEDIHLVPDEYFAHEGDERALFVVVEGSAEITKVVNGEERVIGVRGPGRFFGEVPMTLSTPFPASGRAAEASRILKLDVTAFYTLAAMAPSIPARVAELARRYLESLQVIAAEQPDVEVRLIGPRHDARTHRTATFLTRNQVAFERITLEQPAHGIAYPILELADGTRFIVPTMREVAGAAGLDIEPTSTDYDVVILGGGPAGLTAAVNGAAEGLRTVVIESLAPGGQAGTSTRIENYTGFPFGISGDDLASRALKQAKRLGAEIVVTRTVEAIRPRADRQEAPHEAVHEAVHEVVLDGGETLRAPVVIAATGVEWRTLPVPGVERHLGNGVYYGAARSDAAIAKGADVCIIGAGNSAGQAALFFSRHARSVTMLVRGPSLEASMSRYLIDQIAANAAIRVETRSEVVDLHGERSLEAVDVIERDTGRTSRRAFPVVFVMIGADAVTDWLPPEVARDTHGFVLTGADAAATEAWTAERRPFALETSTPGIFAVGDVRSGSVKRVAAGVGEGGMAIAYVHQYLAQQRPGEPV